MYRIDFHELWVVDNIWKNQSGTSGAIFCGMYMIKLFDIFCKKTQKYF